MKKTLIILFFCAFVSSGYSKEQPNRKAPSQKMNVLFIMADDLSSVVFSKDSARIIAPNLRRLARNGRLFERAYCQSSLCNPSRTSLLTGRRPQDTRIWTLDPNFRGVNPKIVTLPEHFKNNGYYAADIGKIYHNWGQAIAGDPQSWSEPQTNHWGMHSWDWYIPGLPFQMHPEVKKGAAVQSVDVPDEAYLDGRIANAAVNKLRELRETPFFLAVGFWKPHLPYNAPKKYWDMYDREKLPAVKYTEPVPGVPDIAYVNSDEARSYTDVPPEGPISPAKVKELRHGYFASITFMDAQLGKVLDELDRLDLAKNTVIVFVSDNGYHSGEHGQFGKWTNFEIGTQVPLIISGPPVQQKGVVTGSIVELVDVYPTLVDICGLPQTAKPELLRGVSLRPLLNDPGATVKPAAFSQIARPLKGGEDNLKIIGSSVRDAAFRYNAWIGIGDGKIVSEELYDLSGDADNANNLANDKRYLKDKLRMRKTLLDEVQKQ